MKILFLFLLAGYAVKCDDNKYYVVEMNDNDTKYEGNQRQFKVYWNVPTMQCKSKRIPFEDLYQKYGIMQNKNDRFRGEVISILYDPGLFPALLKNESSGRFKFRNGGVPQEGDMQRHLTLFRTVLEQSIPDKEFKGVGIIDFESWRPIFRQNFGVLVPYKDVSYELEKKLHWWWPTEWIQARAKERFEEAGRSFMETTLTIAKEMRPNAVWGYYGFPYCFNMAHNNFKQSCAEKVSDENDRLHWLWSESSALYPSVYSSRDLTASQLEALIRGRVEEAERVNRKAIVLPYFWFRYRDDGYFSEADLKTALFTLYKSNASGFIIWGSSNDVNTIAKCAKLQDYLEKTLGPAIAEYTKPTLKLRDKLSTVKPYHEETTTKKPEDIKPQLDPEYHWIPPENYTKDIEHNVEEEIKKKPGYNRTDNDKVINETKLKDLNDSMLIDLLLNYLKENNNTRINRTRFVSTDGKKQFAFDNLTTASYDQPNNNLEASQFVKDGITDEVNYNYNNLDVRLNNTSIERKERSESYATPNVDENFAVYIERDSEDRTSDIYRSIVETKNKNITYLTTQDISIEDTFFNQNTFSEDDDQDPRSTDFTTEDNNEMKFNDIEISTETYNDFVSATEETEISKRVTVKVNVKQVNSAMTSASTALDQVRSSSQVVAAHKPYICIIFYIYSVVKCLCAVFGNCS